MKPVLNFLTFFVVILGGAYSYAECYCNYGSSGYVMRCDHTSDIHVFSSMGECREFARNAGVMRSDSDACECANSTLWCHNELIKRFYSDRECRSYLSEMRDAN